MCPGGLKSGYLHVVRTGYILVIALAAVFSGCTGVTATDTKLAPDIHQMVIGKIQVAYDARTIAPDRLRRAKEIRLAQTVLKAAGRILSEAGLSSQSGTDTLWIRLNNFRLPRGARWFTAGFKGKDELAALTGVMRGPTPLYSAQVSAQLGSNDRTIGANYSANRALKQLTDMLAWKIAWEFSGANGRRGEEALLATGKREGVKEAILILAQRGQLPYGEFLKFSAAGKVGLENSALATKYDACGLRKVFTLGLSPCKWDPDYR
jgi:hypothetical protein